MSIKSSRPRSRPACVCMCVRVRARYVMCMATGCMKTVVYSVHARAQGLSSAHHPPRRFLSSSRCFSSRCLAVSPGSSTISYSCDTNTQGHIVCTCYLVIVYGYIYQYIHIYGCKPWMHCELANGRTAACTCTQSHSTHTYTLHTHTANMVYMLGWCLCALPAPGTHIHTPHAGSACPRAHAHLAP